MINGNKNETENQKQITKIRHKQAYNPGQNIWNKMEKSSKTGQEKKSLVSNFVCVLTANAKV